MESAVIRWFIAGVFLAFLASVIIADLVGRIRRASPRRPTDRGFRPAGRRPETRVGWKAGGRR